MLALIVSTVASCDSSEVKSITDTVDGLSKLHAKKSTPLKWQNNCGKYRDEPPVFARLRKLSGRIRKNENTERK
jgi:hypothetical protein